MGWTYFHLSREKLISRLTAPRDEGRLVVETLARDVQADLLWSVERITARQKTASLEAGQSGNFIALYLLEDYCGDWGYKALEESMHPFYYSCPLAFLDLAPERCPDWRQGVRKYHQLFSG
jgi:hypothetical protein